MGLFIYVKPIVKSGLALKGLTSKTYSKRSVVKSQIW